MTTLLVVELPDGSRRRCTASCHNARGPDRGCPCGGRYRGLGDPSADLRREVEAHFADVIRRAAALEDAGAWRIVAWRESLDGPLHTRDELHHSNESLGRQLTVW